MHTATHYWALIKKYSIAHKTISAVALLMLLGGGWYAYGKVTAPSTTTRYVLAAVARGTVIAAVSASGQISANTQLDLKPQVSGQITWVGVRAGDTVVAGQALVAIDNTQAQRSYADAQKALTAAQLQYKKDQAQAPITHQQNQDALTTAQENLTNDYNDTFNLLSTTYLDLPAIITAAQDTLYGYDFDTHHAQWNMDVLLNLFSGGQDTTAATGFETHAKADYAAARASYDTALAAYKTLSRTSDTGTLETQLQGTIDMTTAVAQALQSELNFLGAVTDLSQTYNTALPSAFSALQTSTRTHLSTINSDLTALLAEKKMLTSAKQAITTAQQNIALESVGNDTGTNPISLQIEKNNLDKQTADVAQQGADLGLYTVRAPFAGTVASVAAKVGDTASGAVASVVTTQQLAQLSLNEVDAAKVQFGNRATLTFDAIDSLSLTGRVVEIDPVGTVLQGVVSYTVKIALDAQDARIKPGMTVNAAIQTAVKQNVLYVPSSAVKTQNGNSVILTFNPPLATSTSAQGVASAAAPQQVQVEVGISDDTNTEIISGLTEGQQIVARTLTGAQTTTAATTAGARGGGFGGGIRL